MSEGAGGKCKLVEAKRGQVAMRTMPFSESNMCRLRLGWEEHYRYSRGAVCMAS